MSTALSKSQIEKLGNTLVYLSKQVGDFGKTKALKLLFLLEENSIKKYGVPFFGFDFKVWQYGPVVETVYNELNDPNAPLLNKFIKRADYNPDEFDAVSDFNDDEFSNNDLTILNEVVNFARHKTAYDLVQITHGKNSLWRAAAEENNVLEQFKNKTLTVTDIPIDFSKLLEKESYLFGRYEDSLEFIQFNNSLKY